jgi:predicted MFS family arabinose efflux permease
VFFVAGFGLAAWAPLVPFAKARTGIDEGALGLVLLCLGAGSIITLSMAGALVARFGCRQVVIGSAAPLCLTLPLLATASTPEALAGELFVFGAALVPSCIN